eukprot:364316-Chlamydomonas_euryale.AAC.1
MPEPAGGQSPEDTTDAAVVRGGSEHQVPSEDAGGAQHAPEMANSHENDPCGGGQLHGDGPGSDGGHSPVEYHATRAAANTPPRIGSVSPAAQPGGRRPPSYWTAQEKVDFLHIFQVSPYCVRSRHVRRVLLGKRPAPFVCM